MITEKTTLSNIPAGLFVFNGTLGFKSEYRTEVGSIEAYTFESGEMFWGGTTMAEEQASLEVEPIELTSEQLLDAIALYRNTLAEEREEDNGK